MLSKHKIIFHCLEKLSLVLFIPPPSFSLCSALPSPPQLSSSLFYPISPFAALAWLCNPKSKGFCLPEDAIPVSS